MVLDQHEVSGPVGQDARKRIREALLKQHHHQNHKKLANRIPIVRSFADIGKKQSEPHSMDKNGEQTHTECTNTPTHTCQLPVLQCLLHPLLFSTFSMVTIYCMLLLDVNIYSMFYV